jgi:hypothetical protein
MAILGGCVESIAVSGVYGTWVIGVGQMFVLCFCKETLKNVRILLSLSRENKKCLAILAIFLF